MWKLPYSGGWGIAEIHNIHYKNSQLISDYKDPIGVYIKYIFQFSSVVHLCLTLCDPMDSSTQGLPVHHQSLLKLMSIKSVMPSNHLILGRPLLLPPSIIPSIRVFCSESVLHIRWSTYWSYSFSISLSNEYSGLISFRMDWLGLLADQGTLKSLLQHHSSKVSFFSTHFSLLANSCIHT